MRSFAQYQQYFTAKYLMGPNSVRLAGELLETYPLQTDQGHLHKRNRILDLGCGTGLTSLFIARETDAIVYANDLWTDAETNARRFQAWGISDRVIPLQEDAENLTFEKEFFDAVISVDAYHYFAGKEGFFQTKILPYVKSGGMVLIAVPGIQEAYEGKQRETIHEWVGEDDHMFHSCSWWKAMIGEHPDIAFVETWEMKSFMAAWNDWLAIENAYANRDRLFFDTVIQKYSDFVGIAVRKR